MNAEKSTAWLKFLGGFLGWFIIHTALYAILNLPDMWNRSLNSGFGVTIWLFVLLANIIILTVFFTLKHTRLIGLGVLSALAVNFAVSTMLLSYNDALCFVPVTYPMYRDRPRPGTTPRTPSPTATPMNKAPIGFHDGVGGRVRSDQCTAFGWTTDPDDRTIDLNVRVLSDNEEVARAVANRYRPDLTGAGGCPSGTCGFEIRLWTHISASETHTIIVQAEDPDTGRWTTLNNSPKSLNCSRAP